MWGGSLFPWGGQNPLEPAGLGLPVLFGRHMHNFEEVGRVLTEPDGDQVSAALWIDGPLEGAGKRLAAAATQILDSPTEARAMGERGRAVVEAQAGASRRYAEWVAGLANKRET